MRGVLVLAMIGCGGDDGVPEDTGPFTNTEPEPHWALSDAFLPIAHRGGALLAPENTVAAIEAAQAAGARVVEIDLFETADGHLVLLHDTTVDRTTDGTGAIQDLTLAEAQALDAGYDFTLDGGATFPFRGQGVTIPTFEEALAAGPDLYWDVEIKQAEPSIVGAVIAAIEAAGVKDRVFIAGFDDVTIEQVRADHPDYVTNFSDPEYARLAVLTEADEATWQPPGDIAQVPVWYLTQALVDRAHRFGVKVHVWTVNDRAGMEGAIDLGVDGIITDDPVLLLDVLAERGITPIAR